MSRAAILRLLRRTHMYAGLLLFPAVAVYGITGYSFNHPTPQPDADRRTKEHNTLQLTTLNYGPHLLSTPQAADLATMITRAMNTAVGASSTLPRYRLVNVESASLSVQLMFQMESGDTTWDVAYNPGVNGLVQAVRQTAPSWWLPLSRVHVTAGYPQAKAFATSDMRTTRVAWAIVVDGVAILLVYWGLSGLLMWWQNRSQRGIGLVCTAFCLVVIVSIIGPVYAGVSSRYATDAMQVPPAIPAPPSRPATASVPRPGGPDTLTQVHFARLNQAWAVFDTLSMRREAELLVGAFASLPHSAQGPWQDTAFTAFYTLLTLTMFDHPERLHATLEHERALGWEGAMFFSSSPMAKEWLESVGKPTPILEGKYQYHTRGERRPALGKVSLFMAPNDLPDMLVRRWVQQYGRMGFDATLVLSLTGKTPTGQSAEPNQEAEADRQFYLDFVQWPGALVIQEPPFTIAHGVREYDNPPFVDTYKWGPVLTDRAGKRIFVTGSIGEPEAQRAEIEAAIKRALMASRQQSGPVARHE